MHSKGAYGLSCKSEVQHRHLQRRSVFARLQLNIDGFKQAGAEKETREDRRRRRRRGERDQAAQASESGKRRDV